MSFTTSPDPHGIVHTFTPAWARLTPTGRAHAVRIDASPALRDGTGPILEWVSFPCGASLDRHLPSLDRVVREPKGRSDVFAVGRRCQKPWCRRMFASLPA